MNIKRQPISKKKRFDIFKRDAFICQYCGGSPPSIVLEVDHINPVCAGGSNHIDNLITSCFNCNRGKGGTELSVFPSSIVDKAEVLKEKVLQYKELQKLQKKIKDLQDADLDLIEQVYSDSFDGYVFNPRFRNGSVLKFLLLLGVNEVVDAMNIACSRIYYNEDKALKYFCGVCWGKIRDRS